MDWEIGGIGEVGEAQARNGRVSGTGLLGELAEAIRELDEAARDFGYADCEVCGCVRATSRWEEAWLEVYRVLKKVEGQLGGEG